MILGVPDGYVPFDLARHAGAGPAGHVHVARDDARMGALVEALAFLAPSLEVIDLPAWDCLPYDRVAPHGEIVSRRIAALARLAEGVRPRLILTTVNGFLQRLPPVAFFSGGGLRLTPGQAISVDEVQSFLANNGFHRADTVREAGEYAVRGGIIDVYPSALGDPVRIDFFGDEIDSMRHFDAMSQRTTGPAERLDFQPVAEFRLDPDTVQRFRSGYRARFGADLQDDPLYTAVSAGQRHAGMDHWLPLYHPSMALLTDYVPGAEITFDAQVPEMLTSRLEQIAEFYEARQVGAEVRRRGGEGAPYRALPPDALYPTADEVTAVTAAALTYSAFGAGAAAGETAARDAAMRAEIGFAEARAAPETNLYSAVGERLRADLAAGQRVLVCGHSDGSRDRLVSLLADHGDLPLAVTPTWSAVENLPAGTIAAATLPIDHGFNGAGLMVVTEQDILGERLSRPRRRRRKGEEFLREVSSLEDGDHVVHIEHGIGRYDGLQTLEIGGAPHDCLRLVYHGGDKLFLPVENIEVLSRFGSEDAGVVLDKLGGAAWQARKARVKKRIRDMAEQLIRIAAEREIETLARVYPPEGVYEEFCARFPYEETEDQLQSITDVFEDLSTGRPMDRLICGDVGFGKTEVALRAALIVAMQGMQVAVVVPTTLLARQHFNQFKDRFRNLPLKVRQLSRMVTGKEASEVRAALASGACDVVVGTHALLAKTISFSNLGLLVIDEEQHFGVGQKERLKELKAGVHVLTLTATPIPRTLQMALTGVRSMSLIATPPVDRLAVRTFVMPYDGVVLREALMREHFRGGQSFYVCPRIEDLTRVHERLRNLVPELKLSVAHGQMPARELEDVMTQFSDGGFDVLLSTHIVESGLDIPSANTIVIHRADMFGLAQLYQLRGRVGRSKTRAYAYLTTQPGKKLTPAAQRRLEVMQTLDSLGAGFSLASHDMDIRGTGNLLGEEQSGHVKEVGVELYQHLLREAVMAAREGRLSDNGQVTEDWTPQIQLGTPVLIPEAYVPDLSLRLGLYRRVAQLVDGQEIDAFAAELTDRFGPIPPEVTNLLDIIAIKQACKAANVAKVDAGPKGAVVAFRDNYFADPASLVAYIAKQAGTIQMRPDHRLVYRRNWGKPEQRVKGLTRFVGELAALAAGA